ncbi:hypothetical protein J6590_054607 [Homalodisca vitripennis]|nr:hypothetical protein J6590_054607 [Homalodisca vitripennis]
MAKTSIISPLKPAHTCDSVSPREMDVFAHSLGADGPCVNRDSQTLLTPVASVSPREMDVFARSLGADVALCEQGQLRAEIYNPRWLKHPSSHPRSTAHTCGLRVTARDGRICPQTTTHTNTTPQTPHHPTPHTCGLRVTARDGRICPFSWRRRGFV